MHNKILILYLVKEKKYLQDKCQLDEIFYTEQKYEMRAIFSSLLGQNNIY